MSWRTEEAKARHYGGPIKYGASLVLLGDTGLAVARCLVWTKPGVPKRVRINQVEVTADIIGPKEVKVHWEEDWPIPSGAFRIEAWRKVNEAG